MCKVLYPIIVVIVILFCSISFAADVGDTIKDSVVPKSPPATFDPQRYPVQGGIRPLTPKLFEVFSPAGSTQGMFHPLDPVEVKWVPPAGYDSISVQLFRGPMFIMTYLEKGPNGGSLQTYIRNEKIVEGDGYYFKVIANLQDKVYGDSPTFSIRKPFVITNPQPGAVMCNNSGKLKFTWETRGLIPDVYIKIEQGGFSTLTKKIANTGAYEWNVSPIAKSAPYTFSVCKTRQDGKILYCESVPFSHGNCPGK